MKKLTVVGIGAGSLEGMTLAAVRALKEAELIVGYTAYCELIRPNFPDKEYLSTPMMKELDRCRSALERAASGTKTAMICSGDPGIYGMASPILELADEYGVDAEIIPGVTAACSGAALLGSPLTCDFAVISLSDLLTPYDSIEKRLTYAAQADLCIVIYNPSSRKRVGYLRRACELILRYRPGETVCGIARNIGREGESAEITTLSELADIQVDMTSTVFIGNSSTVVRNGKMVTERGYRYEG